MNSQKDALKCGLIILLSYWFCLDFVFPGFFDPLYPTHSDFYAVPGLSILNSSLWTYLEWPRPLGYLLADLVGRLGLQGSILFLVMLTLLNAGLTIRLVQRMTGNRLSWLGPVLYGVFLFSHPDFYINYTHDGLATVSYFFLVSAMNAWYSYRQKETTAALILCLIALTFVAFTKETYFVSALVLWIVQAGVCRTRQQRIAVSLLAFVLCVESIAVYHNLTSTQPFIRVEDNSESPYYVSFSITSVAETFLFYFERLGNPVGLLLVAAGVVLSFRNREDLLVAASIPMAGLAALLPHSVLPNHLETEYAWVGAPLLFAPIIWLPGRILEASQHRRIAWIASLSLFGLAWMAIRIQRPMYEENRWSVQQQRINGNIIESWGRLAAVAQSKDNILVTGLKALFHPFLTPSYIQFEFGDSAQWTVALPRDLVADSDFSVTFSRVDEINPAMFDHAFGFGEDGHLIDEWNKRELQTACATESVNSFSETDGILLPSLGTVVDRLRKDPKDWHAHLQAGVMFLEWGQLERAETLLQQSMKLNAGVNPYPFFFLGQIRETQDRKQVARQFYRRAIELDAEPRNPAFEQALLRLE